MKKHLAIAVLLLSSVAPGAVFAQDAAPPPGPGAPPVAEPPRCGGLLCDMGVFTGGRDPAFGPEPDCGFFCRITGGGAAADAAAAQRAQEAALAQQQQAQAETEKMKPHKVHHKHVAKASPKAKPETAAAAPASAPPAPAKPN